MRDLTSAEYRTVLALLSFPNATERERIRSSGLPTSTYNVVHRRLYEEGWLADLLIPNPGPCGFDGVEFRLSRPAIAQRTEDLRTVAQDPECVLLWSGVHATLSIYYRAARSGETIAPGPGEPDPHTSALLVSAQKGSVPVYFDHSGLWSRFGRQSPPTVYPQGLDTKSPVTGPRGLAQVRQLWREEAQARAGDGLRSSPPASRTHPRLILDGLVQERTALRQDRVPPLEGRRLGEVIFVVGRLRAASGALRLLNALTGECGVFPFLFVASDGRVLLAGLGQTSAETPKRTLITSAARSVSLTLNEHLEPAEVMIEPVEAIEEVVHHRYPAVGMPARTAPGT